VQRRPQGGAATYVSRVKGVEGVEGVKKEELPLRPG